PRPLSFPPWRSPRATRERYLRLMPRDMAGGEGFQPPNGGIKPRHMDQDNQQVAETTDRRVPSSPFDSPSLPPNLPPAIGETAVVLRPARGTTNYLLLSANLRHPTGPCHVTPVRPQAHRRVARNDPKESRKVALGLISRGRLTVRHDARSPWLQPRFVPDPPALATGRGCARVGY